MGLSGGGSTSGEGGRAAGLQSSGKPALSFFPPGDLADVGCLTGLLLNLPNAALSKSTPTAEPAAAYHPVPLPPLLFIDNGSHGNRRHILVSSVTSTQPLLPTIPINIPREARTTTGILESLPFFNNVTRRAFLPGILSDFDRAGLGDAVKIAALGERGARKAMRGGLASIFLRSIVMTVGS